MNAMTRRLQGQVDQIQAFAQAEVEATQELEGVVLVSCFCVLLFLFLSLLRGGVPAHPLGVAPEIRANCVTVGPNLRSCLFLSFC